MSVQTLYSAATGMTSMETKLDVIANNLANIETTAFKTGRVNFEDLFYQNEKLPGVQDTAGQYTPTGIGIGMGSRVQSIQTEFVQGASQQTGRELDVAIQGKGFFQVTNAADGKILYTRAGNFSVNSNGQLVVGSASTGRLLNPSITIPTDAQAISIGADGKVSVQTPQSPNLQQVGTMELASFINPEGLLKLGENLYGETDASGTPMTGVPGQNGFGSVQQNTLEASNVQPVTELINLITTQRAFELNSQVIQAGDQIMQVVANMRRA